MTPLEETLAFPGSLLRRCHQISVGIFLQKCEELQITQLQYAVLAALESKGPMDQLSIAQLIELDRNTTGVVVKNLETRGCVKRRREVSDRRRKVVTITDAGMMLRRDACQRVVDTQQIILKNLNSAEAEVFCALLSKIAGRKQSTSEKQDASFILESKS